MPGAAPPSNGMTHVSHLKKTPGLASFMGLAAMRGSADVTNNFWELIEETIGQEPSDTGRERALIASLFAHAEGWRYSQDGRAALPTRRRFIQLRPGVLGSSSANPWDVILMMEGAVLFAGPRRNGFLNTAKGKAAFPFMIDHLATDELVNFDQGRSKTGRKGRALPRRVLDAAVAIATIAAGDAGTLFGRATSAPLRRTNRTYAACHGGDQDTRCLSWGRYISSGSAL